MEQVKQSTLLKVVSILLIICGVFGILSGAVATFGGSSLSVAAVGATTADGITEVSGAQVGGRGMAILVGILAALLGVLNLIAGIVGVKAAKGKGKAKECKVFAIIILALAIVSLVFNIASSIGSPLIAGQIIYGVIGLVLPILYFIGAKQVAGGTEA